MGEVKHSEGCDYFGRQTVTSCRACFPMGDPLVRLADAARAVEFWKWQFEGCTEAMEDYKRICVQTMKELQAAASERDTLRAEVQRLRSAVIRAVDARNTQDFVGFAEAMNDLAQVCGGKG